MLKLPVVEKCGNCEKISEGFCSVYVNPAGKWAVGGCFIATHIKKLAVEKKKVNPIKASKRGAQGFIIPTDK
jgi:hypothetical protein